tara:strand:+ start:29809 stop:29916 length:108 start_codon:yes stop_codon:yes gene_type:complete
MTLSITLYIYNVTYQFIDLESPNFAEKIWSTNEHY